MTIYICFYDEPTEYDSDVLYDGFCPPEIIPVETPLIISGKTQKIPTPTKEYCYIEIDSIYCYINGKFIPCNFKPIKFECEEEFDKIPRFIIDSIKFTNSSKLDDVWFDISDYDIKSNNLIIETNSLSIKESKNNTEISIENFDINDLEIIIESYVKKGSS